MIEFGVGSELSLFNTWLVILALLVGMILGSLIMAVFYRGSKSDVELPFISGIKAEDSSFITKSQVINAPYDLIDDFRVMPSGWTCGIAGDNALVINHDSHVVVKYLLKNGFSSWELWETETIKAEGLVGKPMVLMTNLDSHDFGRLRRGTVATFSRRDGKYFLQLSNEPVFKSSLFRFFIPQEWAEKMEISHDLENEVKE